MDRVLVLGQQRIQHKDFVAVSCDFGATEDSRFSFTDFTRSPELVDEGLCRFLVGLPGRSGVGERFGSVGADQLLPVTFEQVGAGEDIGPGDISIDGYNHSCGANLAQLVQEAVVPAADPFPFVVADAGKLKSLGWSQAVSLEDGLSRLVRSQLGSLSSF